MSSEERHIDKLAREQLDRRLNEIREIAPVLRPPRVGWLSTLRKSLGMTQGALAKRMGVTRQSISNLEKREVEGGVTLKALEQAAHSLGAELVYAIVPARPLTETLEDRALQVAARMTESVRHTMRLEDQEPHSDLSQRTVELAKELLASPERLWSMPDGD